MVETLLAVAGIAGTLLQKGVDVSGGASNQCEQADTVLFFVE